MSDTPSEGPAKGGRYHHGDLKAALIDVAVSLIAERGVREFSLAEASRRLGVTVAAPYRQIADRDDLLAAVGVRALDAFAAEQRPLFDTLFVAGIDKSRYPEFRSGAPSTPWKGPSAPARSRCAGTTPGPPTP